MFKKFLSIFTVMAVVSSVVLGSYSEVSAKTIVLRPNHPYKNLGLCTGNKFTLNYKVYISGEPKVKSVSIDCPAGERYGIGLDSNGNATPLYREYSGLNGISQSRACPIGKIGTYGKPSVIEKLKNYAVNDANLTDQNCYYGGKRNPNKAKSVKVISEYDKRAGELCKAICVK